MAHTLPLLLALACASDPAAAVPDAEAVEVHDFARLTPAAADRLEGRRVRYRVFVAWALTLKKARPQAITVLAPGEAWAELSGPESLREGAATVEAELHKEYIPPAVGKDGTPHLGRWQYLLDKAAVVRE
jgi:hypothetical protein